MTKRFSASIRVFYVFGPSHDNWHSPLLQRKTTFPLRGNFIVDMIFSLSNRWFSKKIMLRLWFLCPDYYGSLALVLRRAQSLAHFIFFVGIHICFAKTKYHWIRIPNSVPFVIISSVPGLSPSGRPIITTQHEIPPRCPSRRSGDRPCLRRARWGYSELMWQVQKSRSWHYRSTWLMDRILKHALAEPTRPMRCRVSTWLQLHWVWWCVFRSPLLMSDYSGPDYNQFCEKRV